MQIVTCVKRVPTTELQPRIDASGVAIEAAGTQYMLSFYDEIAVEKGVQLAEAHGGEVTVLTLGPSESSKELRECLAKGAAKGLILTDAEWAARDARSTAKVLAAKIAELGADLVLTGRVATDRDNAAVGPMIAHALGWGCVTDVVELEVTGGVATAKREAEGGIETFEVKLPAVITCQKGLAEPRYAGLKGIMAAKKKPLDEASFEDVPNQARVAKLELPPSRPPGRIIGEGVAAVGPLIDALRNEAKVL